MSQERWDVVLTFLQGPLSFQGDRVCRGPVVRLGVNPGPAGVVLDGYRGLDNRQAVITAYDGERVALAPVGSNQVRVAPHSNVNWADIQPIRGPVHLSAGDAFHLGPPERGVSVIFVEARRLGVWEEQQILSEAAAADPEVEPTEVKNLDTQKGIPVWFIPGILVVGITTVVAILLTRTEEIEREVAALGPQEVGEEHFERVDEDVEVDVEVLEGLKGPFQDFIMRPNAKAAGDPALLEPENWDQRYFDFVSKSVVVHARSRRFWARLEQIKDDYAYVVEALQEADMPEVLAGVPYHESRYRSSIQSPACAEGYWQFQPQVANRMGLTVGTCQYKSGYQGSYTMGPEDIVMAPGGMNTAKYVDRSGGTYRCKIKKNGCSPDERRELEPSTAGAIAMFKEPMNDELFREHGVAVQATILTHISGYLDERFHPEGGARIWNIRPALERFIQRKGAEQAFAFYGDSITCVGDEYGGIENYNISCDSVLLNPVQQYAYTVTALHFMAVCYYAKNYGNEDPFKSWRRRYEDEYCSTIAIPTSEEAQKWAGQ